MSDLRQAFAAGYSLLAAWSELLDDINVFPVADGDTGANLRISLAPLRNPDDDPRLLCKRLAAAATGNSGNIAASFFTEFALAESAAELAARAATASLRARHALAEPREGTMLTLFDRLALVLTGAGGTLPDCDLLQEELRQAVLATPTLLPELRSAGVVDAGALAMYIFFDGFFRRLHGEAYHGPHLAELFPGHLRVAADYQGPLAIGSCVDAVVDLGDDQGGADAVRQALDGLGDSLVLVDESQTMKIHLHTADPQQLRRRLADLGTVLRWQDSPLHDHRAQPMATARQQPPLHLVSDAAGSLPRELARSLGISLLDSYIVVGDQAIPESLCQAEEIYRLLRHGQKVSTAQAGNEERHQHYRGICRRFGPSLYLAVGSAYTGNVQAALAWRQTDPDGLLLTVQDSGAASGRLAVIAIALARSLATAASGENLLSRARALCDSCLEWVFINELKYLVAGGRVSRAGGFFGDLLTMKPVVTPTAAGVRKLGVVRSQKAQVAFAEERLRQCFKASDRPLLLLQYSDNRPWLEEEVAPRLRRLLPEAELLLVPLSLTSGVHMGPGTWSLAAAPPPLP